MGGGPLDELEPETRELPAILDSTRDRLGFRMEVELADAGSGMTQRVLLEYDQDSIPDGANVSALAQGIVEAMRTTDVHHVVHQDQVALATELPAEPDRSDR